MVKLPMILNLFEIINQKLEIQYNLRNRFFTNLKYYYTCGLK